MTVSYSSACTRYCTPAKYGEDDSIQVGNCTDLAPLRRGNAPDGPGDACPASELALTSSFTCMATGFFPDPIDCRKYHFCNQVADLIIATTSTCADGYAYNPVTTNCDTRYVASRCTKIVCKKEEIGVFKSFAVNSQYYYICGSNRKDELSPVMFACPSNTIANVATNPVTCVYQCRKTGFFANNLNSNAYFGCTIRGGVWVSEQRNCPGATIFTENILFPTIITCREK